MSSLVYSPAAISTWLQEQYPEAVSPNCNWGKMVLPYTSKKRLEDGNPNGDQFAARDLCLKRDELGQAYMLAVDPEAPAETMQERFEELCLNLLLEKESKLASKMSERLSEMATSTDTAGYLLVATIPKDGKNPAPGTEEFVPKSASDVVTCEMCFMVVSAVGFAMQGEGLKNSDFNVEDSDNHSGLLRLPGDEIHPAVASLHPSSAAGDLSEDPLAVLAAEGLMLMTERADKAMCQPIVAKLHIPDDAAEMEVMKSISGDFNWLQQHLNRYKAAKTWDRQPNTFRRSHQARASR